MDKAKIGAIVSAVAAVMILGSLVTNWFSKSEGKMSLGVSLWSVEFCMGDKCKSESIPTDGDEKAFAYIGKLNFFIGLAAAGLLGFMAFSGFTQKEEFIAKFGKFAMIGAIAFLVLTIGYLVTKPDGLPGVGFSFILAFFGGIAGIVGSKFIKG